MLKIGDFSKLSQVSMKTLRYYDEMGLLKPAAIDPYTAYRYYSVDQLPRLNRILAFKDLGFSLEQIAQVLDEDLPPAQLRGMLRLKQAEVQHAVQAEHERLARIEARLRQIEQEDPMSAYDVVLKKTEPMKIASVRAILPDLGGFGPLINELFAYMGQHGVQAAGAPFSIYHDHEFRETEIDEEFAAPVTANLPAGGRVQVYDLPAAQVACTVHRGRYEDLGQAYTAVAAWIEANGYQIAGPNREIYLQGPEPARDPATYVTEIQFPVVKA